MLNLYLGLKINKIKADFVDMGMSYIPIWVKFFVAKYDKQIMDSRDTTKYRHKEKKLLQ